MRASLHVLCSFCVFLSGLTFFGTPNLSARELPEAPLDLYVARVYKNKRGAKMPYRLFIPRNYNPKKKYPVILWLHGASSRGYDNRAQLEDANAWATSAFASEESQEHSPAFVLAPQCPPKHTWDRTPGLELSRELQLVTGILARLQKEFSIDKDRIYVAGLSMGGFGAWSLATKRPDLIAAVIPMCGGGNPEYAERAAQLPIWVFHGKRDATVPVRRARQMVSAVRKAGGKPRYTEYSSKGHAVWEPALDEPRLLPWLFAQSRSILNAATSLARPGSRLAPTRLKSASRPGGMESVLEDAQEVLRSP